MDSLWLGSDYAGAPTEDDERNEQITFGVIAVFFLVAELWCIFSTVRAFKNPEQRYDLSLVLFYISLHFSLLPRTLFLCKEWGIDYPYYLERYLDNVTVISKDMFEIMFICRMLEALIVANNSDDKILKAVHIFLYTHMLLFFTFLLLYCSRATTVSALAMYCAVTQFMIITLIIFVFVKFIFFWRGLDDDSKWSALMKWILFLVTYMIIILVFRIAINIGEFFDLITNLAKNNYTGKIVFRTFTFFFIELIPSVMINTYLYKLQAQAEEPSELDQVVLSTND